MRPAEAKPFVEGYSSAVGRGDGEREHGEVAPGEGARAFDHQQSPETLTAVFRRDADLGDVANVVAHPGAEQESDKLASAVLHQCEGGFGIEVATAGKPHNVMQKPLRTACGAVLLVDVAVEVSLIGGRDQARGSAQVGFVPETQIDARRQRRRGDGCQSRSIPWDDAATDGCSGHSIKMRSWTSNPASSKTR